MSIYPASLSSESSIDDAVELSTTMVGHDVDVVPSLQVYIVTY